MEHAQWTKVETITVYAIHQTMENYAKMVSICFIVDNVSKCVYEKHLYSSLSS